MSFTLRLSSLYRIPRRVVLMPSFIAGVFLLIPAAAHQAKSPLNAPVIRVVPKAGDSAHSSPLTFSREHDRLLVTVDRQLLGTDFVVRAQVIARGKRRVGTSFSPAIGTRLASGALRLQQKGDALVLFEYVRTAQGQLLYRRRATMPVLRTTPINALVLAAAPLWDALKVVAPVGNHPRIKLSTDKWCALTGGLAPSSYSVSGVPAAASTDWSAGGDTVVYEAALLRLPKMPMRPRIADPRVGFLATNPVGNSTGSEAVRYIKRWRLEKKDSTAPVSDVVRPIVFRIAAEWPTRWVPYVQKAVEDFNPVLESIGFRNALAVRFASDPPLAVEEREVPITWQDSDMGIPASAEMADVDPRTGEMLGSVIAYSTGIELGVQLGYLALGSLDSNVRPPLADSLKGKLIAHVIRHEIGHVLGLDHNFKASTAYPADSLRSPAFLDRMGPTATIMGYSQFNYLPSPEDRVPPRDLLARIGPYDRWTLAWGYRLIRSAATAEAELPILEEWRAVQDTAPYLRTSLPHLAGRDPYDQTDLLGDDLLEFVGAASRNMGRLLAEVKPHPRSVLEAMITLGILSDHIFPVIGGEVPESPYPRAVEQVRTHPVDPAYQLQAVRFVLAHVFYGQDDVIRQMLVLPAMSDTVIVLIDSIPGSGQASDGLDLNTLWRMWQRNSLSALVSRLDLGSNRSLLPEVRRGLCQELETLDRHFTAAATAAIEQQEQIAELREILAPIFQDGRPGSCR